MYIHVPSMLAKVVNHNLQTTSSHNRSENRYIHVNNLKYHKDLEIAAEDSKLQKNF